MDSRARITLISHGPTSALRKAAFPTDEPLEFNEHLRDRTTPWQPPSADFVCSAPERRAQETANLLGLSASIDADLRDCDYGVWAGHELTEIQQATPDAVATWLQDPTATPHGGESIAHLIARVARWLANHTGYRHTLAVTHPAVIRSAIVTILQTPATAFWRLDIEPLSLTQLQFNGRAWNVRYLGLPVGKRNWR
jgi:broad specificity phosphatase PhoE